MATLKLNNVPVITESGGVATVATALVQEGTGINSTGESGGNKFLREDGDGTASWQTVTSATTATNVTVADESSDTTCFPLFVTAATGSMLLPKTGTNLSFNSSTGVLTATGFAGPLTGAVTGDVTGTASGNDVLGSAVSMAIALG